MSEVNDWQPVSQQPAGDDWENVPISAHQTGETMIPDQIPDAFTRRLAAGEAFGRVLQAAGKGAAEGMGQGTPTGFEDATLNHLIELGVFHDPATGRPGPLQTMNEAVMIPAAKLWETINRGLAGGLAGAGSAYGQVVREFGGSQGEAERARRDITGLGEFMMIESGMGRFSRPSVEGPAVMDKQVGGLPTPQDFTAAGKVMESPHAEANLRRMWAEDGIHPAEAVHDAQTDAFVKHEITAPRAIIAYHGSGYNFDRFDLSRVNTGEGNQAYGYGLYFAESKDVAKSYQETLGPKRGGGVYDMDQNSPTFGQFLQMSEGNLYQVRINAEREHFLDLDKPMAEQSPQVRSAFEKLGIEDASAEAAYRRLGVKVGPKEINDTVGREKAASAALAEAGVPGIKYLDRGSRAKGGTQNFVVFDDAAVEITHKNGVTVETIPESWDVKPEEMEAAFGHRASLSAAATEPGDVPLDVQPPQPAGSLSAAATKALDTLFDVGRDIQMKLTPMARGSVDSMATVKDYMNAMRRNAWDSSRIDTDLTKRFSAEQRERMARAMEEESLSLRLGEPESAREHQGLATLEPEERAAVEQLDQAQQLAWLRARDAGLVEGDGIPMHFPRMAIGAKGDSEIGKPPSLTQMYGIRKNSPYTKQRQYLESQETEAALKAKYGDQAKIAWDIRAVNLATKTLEDAISGRGLINHIEEIGKRTGDETVAVGFKPADSWYTVDHPAFWKWRPKFDDNGAVLKDAEGNPQFEQVPIYVRGDFEGPIRAALWQKSSAVYQGMMALKGKTMGLIMNSPMIHNLVEFGRAFPAIAESGGIKGLPALPIRAVKIYFDGNRAKNDIGMMHEAIGHGLVPIGKRFFNQDINAIMEAPDLTPGRSWTAKILSAVPGLFDEAAGTAVKQAIDKAGDFWHNTLLWDRIGDLQMGLYKAFRDERIAHGMDPNTASYLAAHWANRFAGALPKEAMSEAATKVSNFMLFSRSFTFGNLGVMKDMLTGLPKDVLAQIERDAGFKAGSIEGADVEGAVKQAVTSAKWVARRKAMAIVGLDIGLTYAGNSLLQSFFHHMNGSSWSEEEHDYMRRFSETINDVKVHPLSLLNPFYLAGLPGRLSSTAENEPGRQNRIQIGYAKDGTAIYARNPVGKIGDEFAGYFDGPIDMMRKKEGTIARPLTQIFTNDAGFGRKIYDPNAETAMERAGAIWAIVKHLMTSQLPMGQLQAAHDLVTGEGDKYVNLLQAAGPFAGVTFSKGAPGGPQVGEMYANKEKFEFQVAQAMPDIRRQILRGDIAGAQQRMTQIGMDPGYQRWVVKTSLDPRLRLSSKGVSDFYRTASPEARARMDRLRQAPQGQ